MAKIALTRDSEFIVGEDKILVYILATFFFGLFVYGATDAILRHLSNLRYLDGLFTLSLLPAIFFFVKGRNKKIYIRINKNGIYQDEQLVTGWPYFLNAYISQKEVKYISIQDNFVLVVEYLKQAQDKGFRRKIPLTNTQNKSEEDVLEAVKFFWNEYKKDDLSSSI
ncbi:MAG: hypothetical protein ABIT05_04630 [Chitinophagaceae bacterium]